MCYCLAREWLPDCPAQPMVMQLMYPARQEIKSGCLVRLQVLHVPCFAVPDSPDWHLHLSGGGHSLPPDCGGKCCWHAVAAVRLSYEWLCHSQVLHPPMGHLVSDTADVVCFASVCVCVYLANKTSHVPPASEGSLQHTLLLANLCASTAHMRSGILSDTLPTRNLSAQVVRNALHRLCSFVEQYVHGKCESSVPLVHAGSTGQTHCSTSPEPYSSMSSQPVYSALLLPLLAHWPTAVLQSAD